MGKLLRISKDFVFKLCTSGRSAVNVRGADRHPAVSKLHSAIDHTKRKQSRFAVG